MLPDTSDQIGSRFRFEQRETCPACASTGRLRYRCRFNDQPIRGIIESFYRRSAEPWGGGEYRLHQCGTCGTYWQVEIGNDEALDELYGNWATAGEPEEGYDTSNPAMSRDGHELMTVAAYFGKPISELKVLDYGMGWAPWARVAKSLGARVFGFDLSPERMEHARRHGIKTEAESDFDFINTEQMMEHVAKPAEIVAELAGKLRSGGVLKISVPSTHGVEALLGDMDRATVEDIKPIHPLEHINCFTRDGLERLGARYSLKPASAALGQRYAFIRHRDSLDWHDPKRLVKELLRPIAPIRHNLYVWLKR